MLQRCNPANRPQSSISALQTHQITGSMPFSNGQIRVMKYCWERPTFDVWSSDRYFLSIALSPRPERVRAEYIDGVGVCEDIGRLMFVPPGMQVQSGGGSGLQRSLHCEFDPEIVEELLGRPPLWSKPALAEGLDLKCPQVAHIFHRMYKEVTSPGFAQQVMVELLIQELVVEIVRYLRLHEVEQKQHIGGLPVWRRRLIEDRIHSEQAPPQLAELAVLCGMSVRHLTRVFKADVGSSLGEYIETVMINRARDLLAGSCLTIKGIAGELGFANASSFSYAFHRATGAKPSDLRGQLRQGGSGSGM